MSESYVDRMDEARREFGSFPELDESENHIILIARAKGFARFWPAFPSATAQAKSTFAAAQAWLQAASDDCGLCATGEAHEHNNPHPRTASGD